ncbi:lytic transglycosylase domain-containing protein [Agromyces marinus]|uniref:Transglycosylase SLT domain-containing protein n=1 Tax=Agromyces marinus TaxID=1389020 RepID=A0ABM8H069_9MICO|nr:lytic transglycosylase domain-containing protein [Agromyces marinus]UIP57689.1 hypothetical protein DSM26151_05540 [Agromyces marinus]BDZ54147.1 hypothetical protein GCM10025870_12200 [Agromyces marinus]
MSWDDDAFGDGRRVPGARAAPREIALRIAGGLGLVAAVVALVVGVVSTVTFWGVATNPEGFAALSASGQGAPVPPLSGSADAGNVGADSADRSTGDPSSATGSGVSPLVEPELPTPPAVDADWIAESAAATGIPERALSAYALAHVAVAEEEPRCGLDWTTIAAIGAVESRHGGHGGATLADSGLVTPEILGPALDGDGVAAIHDTDDGLLDGDRTWDRAVGPMQFIPSTWEQWGTDADGDGIADPHDIDDAANAAARYLCASGPMTTPDGWREAVFSYNHDDAYVDKVATIANGYLAALG